MFDFRLYLITDRSLCAPQTLVDVIQQACDAGVSAIQLREKDLTEPDLAAHVTDLSRITKTCGARLLINRHASPGLTDEAFLRLTENADGIHLPEDASMTIDRNSLVGMSVHSIEGAERAVARGANFVTFGPIFETPSKKRFGPPHGIDALSRLATSIAVPVIAIGGINTDRVKQCIDAGAHGVAVISAIMNANDIGEVVRRFETELGSL